MADFTFRARTAVVGGALAFQMRRAAAARSNECGLQILTIPQLAARLPGGFTTSISSEHLDLAVQRALAEGGFLELETVRYLRGMTRAVSRTLRKVWDADIDLQSKGRTIKCPSRRLGTDRGAYPTISAVHDIATTRPVGRGSRTNSSRDARGRSGDKRLHLFQSFWRSFYAI